MSSLKKYVGIVVDRRPHVEPRVHFVLNAFFRSPALKRMYGVLSITDGFSQESIATRTCAITSAT